MAGLPEHVRTQRLFVLGTCGGNRKTFVNRAIQRFLKFKGKLVREVSSSAVAAQHLDDVKTAHFAVRISIPVTLETRCSIEADSQLAHALTVT